MNSVVETRPERRQKARKLVDELQQERNQVWSLYTRIADLKPFSSADKVQSALNEFSQLMIDYISLGEFGIYRRVIEGRERRIQVKEAAERMYPEYTKITDAAVTFNDKYNDNQPDPPSYSSLEQDLSDLGEKLARRIEIEDHICSLIVYR